MFTRFFHARILSDGRVVPPDGDDCQEPVRRADSPGWVMRETEEEHE
ncbi:MAG: hypothetical protein J6B43_10535 [Lachnospiraceae bacterium]|nr:hypothetical protein [Lachnospiraceae bacterium]